jgi:hypothetical protein
MDKELLVKSGQQLITLLDGTEIAPDFAMWVLNSEHNNWKLWIVPSDLKVDKKLFYGVVSRIISENFEQLNGMEVSAIELVDRKNPAVKALGQFIHMDGLGSAHFGNNSFNGFYLPDGIILRSRHASVAA